VQNLLVESAGEGPPSESSAYTDYLFLRWREGARVVIAVGDSGDVKDNETSHLLGQEDSRGFGLQSFAKATHPMRTLKEKSLIDR